MCTFLWETMVAGILAFVEAANPSPCMNAQKITHDGQTAFMLRLSPLYPTHTHTCAWAHTHIHTHADTHAHTNSCDLLRDPTGICPIKLLVNCVRLYCLSSVNTQTHAHTHTHSFKCSDLSIAVYTPSQAMRASRIPYSLYGDL